MEKRVASYRVLEEIAAGGHATVYRVWDDRTGRVMALKVMHPHLSRDTGYVERFQREALMAASVEHPNVIHIYEVGQDGESRFIAMEHLPLSLSHLLKGQGSLPVSRAVDIALQVALGLEAARQKGIVHRDIKPQNILIGADGSVKITDFGIARGEDLATMTGTGMVLGTPSYIAPEQARGEPLDSRSDLYSLGVVLYQMLAGRLPFEGDTPWDVIRRHIEEPPPSIREGHPEVPPELAGIVDRCLRKDRAARYGTPQELADALMDVRARLSDVPVASGAPVLSGRAHAAPGGRWKWFAAGAALVAALVVFAAFGGGRISGFWSSNEPRGAQAPLATATPVPTVAATPTPSLPGSPGPTPQPSPTAVASPSPVPSPRADGIRKALAELRAGQSAVVDLTPAEAEQVGVSRVEFVAAEPITGGELVIQKAAQPGTSTAPGAVFSYFDVGLAGASSSSVKSARITFQVPSSWIREHRVGGNKVALYRYQEKSWAAMRTQRQATSVDRVTFTAATPGFSLFAVSGLK